MRRESVAAALLVLFSASASAADHHVAPGQSIQAAIDGAQDGDRVLVQPGTYVESVVFKGKKIRVIGVGGASATTIRSPASWNGPVVAFHQNEGALSVLKGLTVTGGVLAGFLFPGIRGAGISAVGTPLIEDCIVRNNANDGSDGGGVGGDPIMRRCVIVGNIATAGYGAGVYGSPTMEDCLIADNHAWDGAGGGLYSTGATDLDRVTFVLNSASDHHGGGLSGTASVSRCIFVLNSASLNGEGGAIATYPWNPPVIIDRSVFISNSGLSTGGVYGPATLKNCIVRGNVPGQIANVTAVTYSNVEGGYPGTGNFDALPQFADPTRDLHLRPTSPCIDAGDPNDLDPDGSIVDVGAYPFARFYVRDNLEQAYWFDPAWPQISTEVGGKQRLRLLADPSDAGTPYWTVGSASGTSPGTPIGPGIVLPLNVDAYFFHTTIYPDQPPLVKSTGLIDLAGLGDVIFTIPGGLATGLEGLNVHHAALLFGPSPPWIPAWVTSAEHVELVK